MKVLHSWLRKYTPIRMTPEALTERLTMLGLEFERVENLGDAYEGFVVGRVVTCERHPAADTLSVCSVDVGGETLQIVCGAPNVAAGQRVAVGRAGAVVPHGQKDGAPFTLGAVKIRGIDSHGMICSEYSSRRTRRRDGRSPTRWTSAMSCTTWR